MLNLTIEHFVSFVEIHRYTGYFILFLAMVLEGETVLILAGALAELKAFDIGDVSMIAFSGVVIGNMLWYYVGFRLSEKSYTQKMIMHAKNIIMYFLPNFRERPFRSIFFSKFIYGTNRATVFMSGVFKIHFSLFMKAEVLASILWVAAYTTIGYFFGYVAIQMTRRVTHFALLIVIFVVVFVLLQRLLASSYERQQLKKTEEDHNSQR